MTYKTLTTLCCKACSPGAGRPEILPRDLTTSAPRCHLCREKLPSYTSSPTCKLFKPAPIFYSLHIDVSRLSPVPIPVPAYPLPPPSAARRPDHRVGASEGSEGRRNHRAARAASGARPRAATRRRVQDGGGAAGLSEAAAGGGAGPGRAEG